MPKGTENQKTFFLTLVLQSKTSLSDKQNAYSIRKTQWGRTYHPQPTGGPELI